jgi:lipid-binding SYLF domain-containing protein
MKKISVALLVLIATAAWAQSGARSADIERVQSAATILSQIMEAPDRGIPDSIMSGAKCIAIIPSMMKVSFILGANYGKGVATCRTGKGWSSPAFFRVEGGSFGFQAGGQASDLVLIIRTDDGMQHLLQSKFKLGADASAAAGPVGRDTQAATDLTMRAQVLTYSRARGLFLGVSLSGAVIRQNDDDVRAFYGKDWTFYSLLNGEVPPPQEAQALLATVERYAPTRHAVTPAVATTPAPTTAPVTAPVTPAESTSSATPAVAPAPASADDSAPAPAASADPTVSTVPMSAPVKTPIATPVLAPTTALPADPAGSGNKQP